MAFGFGEGLNVFSGMVSAAKTVREGIRKLSGEVDQEMRNTLNLQIGDLIDAMQDMRERYSALFDRMRELERENGKLREFEINRENYILEAIGPHSFAYTAKADGAVNKTNPHLCTHCFERKVKSILQFEKHEPHTDMLKCHACGSTAHKNADRGPAVMFAAMPRRGLFE
ncbi:hypothetical protein KHC23_00090 [Ancylobacter dichloromethanicus]|uniref:Uncharacterized protein n=1 Tax=Ancylobacter dichloromethanicus TaxID=518825 RepID=A0A9W6N1Z6_9HYPH|nr:hypothetical protein [Ancylobacter dichloromethanicus]MBS7552058.1 hypothetical protein [Ancylobacter dichloromethanicus]GLK74695.1 hypothetical protein GCM10017643_48140 [Ancylobacter dichloromethanicus]